jgi:hypothetical protein
MIDRKVFFTKLYEKITDAIKQCDDGNVIDLRLFKNNNCLGDGVFSIFEGEELYNEVKDCDTWFVDFYENIKGENCAEFVDIVLWSDEFTEKTEDTPKTMSVEEFDAKWGETPNRSEMDFETELEFIEDCFNMYETSGFSATYHSIDVDDENNFEGVAFQVIGRASYSKGDCDLEQLPMWHIEFEDGTKHMAFPEEITKIERERQTLAQNLHKEEKKPIKTDTTMDRYEQIKNKLESFASEDELVEMWNVYVSKNRETITEDITIYLNTANNIALFMTWMSKEGIAKSFHNGNYDSRDRYIYECADRLFTANSMFAIISTEGLERFYDFISKDSAKKEWENDSAKAITLWNQPYEEVRVEITKDWVKFFRRDDMLTCYTYRPLHLLKCDNYFIGEIKATLEESCQYNEEEFNNWLKNDCDMPPFPISVIFTSDYTEYTCKVYGE